MATWKLAASRSWATATDAIRRPRKTEGSSALRARSFQGHEGAGDPHRVQPEQGDRGCRDLPATHCGKPVEIGAIAEGLAHLERGVEQRDGQQHATQVADQDDPEDDEQEEERDDRERRPARGSQG
jgi:hypothetical protein